MPPTTKPVPERILENLEATLIIPDGGASYYYDVAMVLTPGTTEFQMPSVPGIAIFPEGATSDDTELLFNQSYRWDITIVGILRQRTGTAPDDLIRFAHDIYNVLQIDPTRGGDAIDTKWRGFDLVPPTDDNDNEYWVQCRIQIIYRTDDGDMNVAR